MPELERYKKLGLLQTKREELAQLEDRAEGILGSIRDATFVVASVWDLDGSKVANYGRELRGVLEQGQALRSQIDALKNELGVD